VRAKPIVDNVELNEKVDKENLFRLASNDLFDGTVKDKKFNSKFSR